MSRARALAPLLILLLGGCQSLMFGAANLGVQAPAETVIYDSAHGLALDVYRPARVDAHTPVVLFFYGGSWQRGSRQRYAFVGQRLARMGAVALVADYRLHPEAVFPAFVEDGARAVAWAYSQLPQAGARRPRLFLAGHSAGAHIAALLATDARYLQPHGLSPADLAGVIGLAGPYDFEIDAALAPVFGPPAQWPQAQPLRFAGPHAPPFLLVWGRTDKVVAPAQSLAMARTLRTAGVPVRTLLLEGGHGAPMLALWRGRHDRTQTPALRAFLGLEASAPD